MVNEKHQAKVDCLKTEIWSPGQKPFPASKYLCAERLAS